MEERVQSGGDEPLDVSKKNSMPVIPLRYRDPDIAPIKAFANARKIPLSTAIKQLAKLGLLTVEDGATQQDQANRLQATLMWTLEGVMILRLLSATADKTLLARAQAAAKELYNKHVERI